MAKKAVEKKPITVSGLIKWLKTKPAGGRYTYGDNHKCLLAQYLKAKGFKDIWVGGITYTIQGKSCDIPYAAQNIVGNRPLSYGAALKRARAA